MKKIALLLPGLLAAAVMTGCGASDADCNMFADKMVEMLSEDLGEKKASKFTERRDEYFDVCKETANPREIACIKRVETLEQFMLECNY